MQLIGAGSVLLEKKPLPIRFTPNATTGGGTSQGWNASFDHMYEFREKNRILRSAMHKSRL
jgi:hypothetical protein